MIKNSKLRKDNDEEVFASVEGVGADTHVSITAADQTLIWSNIHSWIGAGSMLGQRRRRWTSIEQHRAKPESPGWAGKPQVLFGVSMDSNMRLVWPTWHILLMHC